MIINDTHAFAFVHIPKCAGTSARRILQHYDETGGRFTSRIDSHPNLGCLNYVHIPLFALRMHFPREYQKLCDYSTYALLRNPFARFPSSVAQHLKEYSRGGIKTLTTMQVEETVEQVIVYLEGHDEPQTLLPKELIHFQRQIDYVQDGDRLIVDKIFDCASIDSMLMEISRIADLDTGVFQCESGQDSRINQSMTARNRMADKVYDVTSKLAGPYISLRVKKALFRNIRSLFFVPWQQKLSCVFQTQRVLDFVEHYYQEDIALYALKIESAHD